LIVGFSRFVIRRSVSNCDGFLRIYVGIGTDLNRKCLRSVSIGSGAILLQSCDASFLCFLKAVNGFLGSNDHIIFRVNGVVPVGNLIYAKRHCGSNFSRNGWWFDSGNDLMLKLSHYIVYEEDCSPCCEHAHRNIVKSKSSGCIFANLDVVCLAVYCLYLLVFGKGHSWIFALKHFSLKDVFGLIGDSEVDQLCRAEFVGNLYGKFDLLIKKT